MTDGPGGSQPAIDAKSFLATYNQTTKFGLSLGWTTGWQKDPKEGYTEVQTKAMQEIVGKHVALGGEEALNFPIRALYAVKSQTFLKNFYDSVKKDHPKVTYSIFSSKNDKIAAKDLGDFVKLIGVENVYLILTEGERNQLNLGKSGASGLVQFGLLNLAMLIVVAIFRNGLH